jgi:HK97 family phage portal protein
MSMLARVAAQREAIRASDPITMAEFDQILAGTTGGSSQSKSGVRVTTDRALGVSAWWRGARWLSETVASLPTHTYRKTGPNERERVANPRWTADPNVIWFAVREFIMMSLTCRGNAFLWKDRGLSGQVERLIPIHPDDIKFGTVGIEKVFEIDLGDGQKLPATTRDVFHVPGLSTNGFFGMDPIRVFANSLGGVIAADEFAQVFYDNNSAVGAYISMPGALDNGEAERVKAQWDRLHKGLTHAHEFGVIGDGATYNTIGLDAEQTQILGARKFSVTEVARMLGVVPHKLYDLERATFSNIEQQAIEAVTDSVRPYVVRLEAYINPQADLVTPGSFLEMELEGLLRGDIKSRYEAYSLAIGGPWLEANEARRLENKPARPELDTVLQPLNMTVAGSTPMETP